MTMAQQPVVILHGWSDESSSFQALANFLENEGFTTRPIFLGDYLSMHDEVTLPDLGRAMGRALADAGIPQERHSFDLLVHSTGGLVGREYLRQACQTADGRRDPRLTPIRRFVFLAPANFGSPLAHIGKSMLGRLFKGWDWDRPLETGREVLRALELASPYSAGLALDDRFDPDFPVFSPEHTLATVMTGTVSYPNRLKRIVHENGSDGTVRVSTANLNAARLKVRFADPSKEPEVEVLRQNGPEIPLAVFRRDHGNIIDPNERKQRADYRETLLRALRVTRDGFAAHREACAAITDKTYAAGMRGPKRDRKYYHRYMNVVFYVHDQFGGAVDDYFVEFYQEHGDDDDEVFEKMNREVLENVHVNSTHRAWRNLYFDLDDLQSMILDRGGEVSMSLVAAAISDLVGYANPPNLPAVGGAPVFGGGAHACFFPNQTLLVDIEVTRTQSPAVFTLTPFGE